MRTCVTTLVRLIALSAGMGRWMIQGKRRGTVATYAKFYRLLNSEVHLPMKSTHQRRCSRKTVRDRSVPSPPQILGLCSFTTSEVVVKALPQHIRAL